MTARNTKDEWLTAIELAEKGIPSTFMEYKAPGLGSEEFAKSIDHTLLKLDATRPQIDELCAEAKKHNFKVELPAALLCVPEAAQSSLERPKLFNRAPRVSRQHCRVTEFAIMRAR